MFLFLQDFRKPVSSFHKSCLDLVESLLCLVWRDVSDSAVQAFGVVPADPFEGFPLDMADGLLGAEEIDHFSFIALPVILDHFFAAFRLRRNMFRRAQTRKVMFHVSM